MQFTVVRQTLLDAMQVAGSIISPRAIRPILANVHLVVGSDNVAQLHATDLEIAIRFNVPLLEVTDPGEAVIPAARVTAILRECDVDEVRFSADGTKVKLQAGRSTFQLLSENPEEFPPIPTFNAEAAFGLNREKLVTLMRKTQFAAAREKSRFAFNGAKLLIEGDEARMIATDGKRLAMHVETIDNSDGVTAGHIVPARALTVFDKVLSDEDDLVRITLDDSDIMVKTTRAEISSRLVEGSFPNYKAVIPQDCPHSVRFPRETLMRAFRQAALLTSQETRSVKLTLSDGRAVLSAQALDAGEATIEIDAPDYTGDELQIAFNPDYLAEGLKHMDADEVVLGLSRPNQPAKITGDENFVYVVMPVTMRSG